MYLQLLRSSREREDLLRLLRKLLQFRAQPVQRLIEGEKFFAVFFQELAARVEGKPAFTRGQERKKQLRTLPHRLNRSRHLWRVELFALQKALDVARQFVHPQVANRNSKVVAGDFFQFVRFVENNGAALGKDAGVGRALGFEFDGEVGEEEVMIDDDDVALSRAPPHLGDEAMLPFLAFLPETGIGAGVELVPKSARLGQFREFRAVARLRGFLPCGDGAVLLDLFQAAEHRLVGEIEKFFAAEIVVAPLHIADAQFAIPFREQCPLQRRNIFEVELLLQVLRTG